MKRLAGLAFDAYRNTVDIVSIITEGLINFIGDAADRIGERIDIQMDVWDGDDDE